MISSRRIRFGERLAKWWTRGTISAAVWKKNEPLAAASSVNIVYVIIIKTSGMQPRRYGFFLIFFFIRFIPITTTVRAVGARRGGGGVWWAWNLLRPWASTRGTRRRQWLRRRPPFHEESEWWHCSRLVLVQEVWKNPELVEAAILRSTSRLRTRACVYACVYVHVCVCVCVCLVIFYRTRLSVRALSRIEIPCPSTTTRPNVRAPARV